MAHSRAQIKYSYHDCPSPTAILPVNSRMSRNGTSEDFLESAQSSLSTCLNCCDLVFVPSCWLGCLSFTLDSIRAIPTYPLVRRLRPRNLVKKISNPAKEITGSGKCPSLTGNKLPRFQTETCYRRSLGRYDRLGSALPTSLLLTTTTTTTQYSFNFFFSTLLFSQGYLVE